MQPELLKSTHGSGIVYLLIILAIIGGIGVVVFFSFNGSPANNKNIKSTNIEIPIYYDNGVYYFDSTGAKFANSLSAFIEQNNVRVLSVSGDGTGGYGVDVGYFVVVEKR